MRIIICLFLFVCLLTCWADNAAINRHKRLLLPWQKFWLKKKQNIWKNMKKSTANIDKRRSNSTVKIYFTHVVVKILQSSFPPFHNLVKIKVHFDKLNNSDLFLQCKIVHNRLIGYILSFKASKLAWALFGCKYFHPSISSRGGLDR